LQKKKKLEGDHENQLAWGADAARKKPGGGGGSGGEKKKKKKGGKRGSFKNGNVISWGASALVFWRVYTGD